MTPLKTFSNQVAHDRDKTFLLVLTLPAIIIFLAAWGAYKLSQATLNRERQKILYQNADTIQQSIEERMLAYVNYLRGLQALWASHHSRITPAEFSSFINTLNIFNDYPGIASIAYVKQVGDQWLTTYVEPAAGRNQTLNYNHAADPDRKPYFELARDSGEIIATGPIKLITTHRPGFFLIAPLYQANPRPDSLIERRQQLTGFIGMVFRETQLFEAIFGRQNPLPNIDFAIFSGHWETPPEPRQLLFATASEFNPTAIANFPAVKRYVFVGQTPWTIFISPKASFSLTQTEENLPRAILISGLIFAGLYILTLLLLYRRHLKTWR
jgi:CHASE1-domain containing sensor protein